MCGRYTYKLTWTEIVELYRLTLPEEQPESLKPNWNVAPTHVMPIIRPAGNGRELVMAGWGLVPFWLKPDQLGKLPYSTINARDDRVQTAPTYRELERDVCGEPIDDSAVLCRLFRSFTYDQHLSLSRKFLKIARFLVSLTSHEAATK